MGLAGPATEVVGYIPDPAPWLAAARLMVVPARFGAGIKLKLLDAMAAGLPFVTTPIGAEGLCLGDLERLLVAKEPSELVRRAWALLSSPDLWAEVQERLLSLATTTFGPDAFRETLVETMATLGFSPPRTY